MREIFESSIRSLEGEAGIIFKSLDGDISYDFELNADKVMPAASIIKLPILWSVMQKVGYGEIALSDMIPVQDGDMFGEYDAQHHPLTASEYAVGDLCRLMIDLSDNLASNMLIRLVGMENINLEIKKCGLKHTVLQRKFLDFETQARGFENYTTPNESVKMVTLMLDSEKRGLKIGDEMLEILAGQCDKNYLSQYMPDTFKFAHKTGHIPGTMHNVGIITTSKQKKYISAVMTTKLKSDVEGLRFLNTVGEEVFKFLAK